jgi:hypothetical protein
MLSINFPCNFILFAGSGIETTEIRPSGSALVKVGISRY